MSSTPESHFSLSARQTNHAGQFYFLRNNETFPVGASHKKKADDASWKNKLLPITATLRRWMFALSCQKG